MDHVLIKDIRPGQKNISLTFIILEVGPLTRTRENREIRTFKVADNTACINVSIWDEPGRLLFPGDIVRMTKAYASVWRSSLTLYSGKTGEIQKVSDFCMVFNEQLNMSEPNPNLAKQLVEGDSAPVNSNANNSITNNGNANSTTDRTHLQTNTTTATSSTSSSSTSKSDNGGGGSGIASGSTRFSSEPSAKTSTSSKGSTRGRGGYRNNGRADRR